MFLLPPMARYVTADALTHHLEVAISAASRPLLSDLDHADRYRRTAAVATLARHLADRMSSFEITAVDAGPVDHPSLFGNDHGG